VIRSARSLPLRALAVFRAISYNRDVKKLWGALLVVLPLAAQSVRVYSEFAKLDANGEVVSPAQPREILSPALVRNGFTSFQVVVQVPKETPYWLYIGENPENLVHVKLYRRTGDHLENVEVPHDGESTEVFWLDLQVDREAPVRRVKIEPQLKAGTDWFTYPMEVRIVEAAVPNGDYSSGFLCGNQVIKEQPQFRARNFLQDVALASQLPKDALPPCTSDPTNPEWYLKIRDVLFRMR
jgi:hypothetical protein